MPLKRYAEGRDIMEEFGRADPGNKRVPQMAGHLKRFERLDRRIKELSKKRASGKLDAASAFELAECYRQMQQRRQFLATLQDVLRTKNLPFQYWFRAAAMLQSAEMYPQMIDALAQCRKKVPPSMKPEIYLEMARMYRAAGALEEMRDVMTTYVKKRPSDWRALLDVASLDLTLGNQQAAVRSLHKALSMGGQQARALIEQDPRFRPLLESMTTRTQGLMNLTP